MPLYEYECADNGQRVEVLHSMSYLVETWAELCYLAGREPGDTDPQSLVRKVVSAPQIAFPKTNSELKNMGFTKLVKRDKGVYENVTATDREKRYMNANDPSSMPDLKSKITD